MSCWLWLCCCTRTRFGGSSLTTPNRSEHIVLWVVEVADYDSHHVYLKNIATQTWLTGRPGQTATMTPHKDEVNGRFELIVQVPLAARWVCSHQLVPLTRDVLPRVQGGHAVVAASAGDDAARKASEAAAAAAVLARKQAAAAAEAASQMAKKLKFW